MSTTPLKLFLDDEREAPPGWTLCRSVEALRVHLRSTAQIEAMSLDYDMGSGYETGLHALDWILKEVKSNPSFTPPASIRAHTRSIDMGIEMRRKIGEIHSAVIERGPR